MARAPAVSVPARQARASTVVLTAVAVAAAAEVLIARATVAAAAEIDLAAGAAVVDRAGLVDPAASREAASSLRQSP